MPNCIKLVTALTKMLKVVSALLWLINCSDLLRLFGSCRRIPSHWTDCCGNKVAKTMACICLWI